MSNRAWNKAKGKIYSYHNSKLIDSYDFYQASTVRLKKQEKGENVRLKSILRIYDELAGCCSFGFSAWVPNRIVSNTEERYSLSSFCTACCIARRFTRRGSFLRCARAYSRLRKCFSFFRSLRHRIVTGARELAGWCSIPFP